MNNILVCSFSNKHNLLKDIEHIKKKYELPRNKIFVFEAKGSNDSLFITFNVPNKTILESKFIPIHRKSQTNTLYTINALNTIVRRMNNGLISENVQVPWENYENSLLLSDEYGDLKNYELDLLEIVDI